MIVDEVFTMNIGIKGSGTPAGCINYSEIYSKIWAVANSQDFWFHTGNIYYKLVDTTQLRAALNEEKTLSWRDTSGLTYIPGFFDCTDYAKSLLGYLVKYFYPNSPCIGITFIRKPAGNHNMLFFMDIKKDLFLLEPQADIWTPWTSGSGTLAGNGGVFM